MPKKTTKENSQEEKRVMSPELMTENIIFLKNMCETLNIAIAGVAYAAQVQGEALKNVKVEDYVSWIQKNLHPIVRDANDLQIKFAKKASKEVKKTAKKATKEK